MSERGVQGPTGDDRFERDWVDIIGTGLVVASVVVAILSLIIGFFWLADRNDERRTTERIECVERGWLWADDRCIPLDVLR